MPEAWVPLFVEGCGPQSGMPRALDEVYNAYRPHPLSCPVHLCTKAEAPDDQPLRFVQPCMPVPGTGCPPLKPAARATINQTE